MNSEQEKLQEAKKASEEGNDLLRINYLKFRFTPKYIPAIPLLRKAADLFHELNSWNEEINLREQLIHCFRAVGNDWEQGNEYEKIFKIKLFHLNKPLESFYSICYANNAYNTGRHYETSVKALTKAANDFFEQKADEYYEKTLSVVYSSIIHLFHVLVLEKKVPHEFIYKAFNNYINVLFVKARYDEVITVIQQIIRTIDHDEDDKSKLVGYYIIGMISSIGANKENTYDTMLLKAKEISQTLNDNNKALSSIEKIHEILLIGNANESSDEAFDSAIAELSLSYPAEIINSLKDKRSNSGK